VKDVFLLLRGHGPKVALYSCGADPPATTCTAKEG
jgi:hypothetical protein